MFIDIYENVDWGFYLSFFKGDEDIYEIDFSLSHLLSWSALLHQTLIIYDLINKL